MDAAIKNIISLYIKIPADQINTNTIIDRTAVTSSIMLHRMYAHLANENFAVADYWDIKDFGGLQKRINVRQDSTATPDISSGKLTVIPAAASEDKQFAIGIDIEQISNMPLVADYREDEFYTMNFAPAEIAYCILQSNSAASFAGLFAAKEAIIKANNFFLNKPFHSIQIVHLPNGKPVHPGFKLSISHTNDMAIAVAIALDTPLVNTPAIAGPIASNPPAYLYLLVFAAFFLSLFTLFLYFFGK